jgi:prophage DNA circulation protein
MSGILGPISGAISGANRLVQTVGSTVTDVARIGQSLGGALEVDNSGLSFAGGAWWQQLQPGSWRGVGFVLDAGQTKAGRRVAIHEYPYRDTAWSEDLGLLPRRFAVEAYLTGDDVYQQRDAMLAACEQPGPGTLVHPTLGTVQCVLLDFTVTDRRERGRYVEVALAFILAGDVLYPSTALSTGDAITTAAANLNTASATDLGSTLAGVASTVHSASAAVGQFTAIASTAVNDAGRIFNSVRGLTRYFGRFSTGSRSTLLPATATVQTALSAATTARTLVNSTAHLVNVAASLL